MNLFVFIKFAILACSSFHRKIKNKCRTYILNFVNLLLTDRLNMKTYSGQGALTISPAFAASQQYSESHALGQRSSPNKKQKKRHHCC